MPPPKISIGELPAWAHLNSIAFSNIKVADIEGKGYGVICEEDLTSPQDTLDTPTLLTVPHNLVLNAAAVEEYAKEDRTFRQLLDAVKHRVGYS